MTQQNPLLDFSDVPLFDRITPEHVSPAVDALMVEAQAALDTVTASDFPANWLGISAVLDAATEKLGRAWGAVSHLNAVADTPELRAAYNAALPVITEFYTRLGADERLYAKYKAIDVSTLNLEQKQAHKNAMRNFVLSGAELMGVAKERFAKIQ
ncbi:MAG: oligopeptidase A, partial [Vitreoscilla sp.]|nr:oligopeptidase A [Polaromonas sp.]